MTISAQCENCSQKYRLKDEYSGKTLKCKKCGQGFSVPELDWEEDVDFDTPRMPRPPGRKKKRNLNKQKKKQAEKKRVNLLNNNFVKTTGMALSVIIFFGVVYVGFKSLGSVISETGQRKHSIISLEYNGHTADQWLRIADRGTSRYTNKEISEAKNNIGLDPSLVDTMLVALGKEGFGRNFADDYLKRFKKEHLKGQQDVLVKHLIIEKQRGDIMDLSQARVMSAYLLGLLGEDARDAVPHLAKALDFKTKNPKLRPQIISTLGKIGGKESELALIESLKGPDVPENERLSMISSLSKLKHESIVPIAITEYEKPNKDIFRRQTILYALGNVGNKEAIEKLSSIIISEDEREIDRVNAIKALLVAGNNEAIDAIEKLIESKPNNKEVYYSLISSMSYFSGKIIKGFSPDRNIDRTSERRKEVANPKALTVLIKIIEKDDNEKNRLFAIRSLAGFGKEAIPILESTLKEPSINIQFASLQAVEKMGPSAEPLLPVLKNMLLSYDPELIKNQNSKDMIFHRNYERTIVQAISSIGKPAIPVLALALDVVDKKHQEKIFDQLVELKITDQEVLGKLMNLVEGGSIEAIYAIGSLSVINEDIPATTGQLISIVKKNESYVKNAVKDTKLPALKPSPKHTTNNRNSSRFGSKYNQNTYQPPPTALPPELVMNSKPKRDNQYELKLAILWATKKLGEKGEEAQNAIALLETSLKDVIKARKKIENSPGFHIKSFNVVAGLNASDQLQKETSQLTGRTGGGYSEQGVVTKTDLQGNSVMTIYDVDKNRAQERLKKIQGKISDLKSKSRDLKQFEDAFQKAIKNIKQ